MLKPKEKEAVRLAVEDLLETISDEIFRNLEAQFPDMLPEEMEEMHHELMEYAGKLITKG